MPGTPPWAQFLPKSQGAPSTPETSSPSPWAKFMPAGTPDVPDNGEARSGVSGVGEDLARGLGYGLTGGAQKIAGDLAATALKYGGPTAGTGYGDAIASKIRTASDENAAAVQQTFDPRGIAGAVGSFAGQLPAFMLEGEALGAPLAAAGSTALAGTRAAKIAEMLTGKGSSWLTRGFAKGVAEAPANAAMGAINAPPGEEGQQALEWTGLGIAGGVAAEGLGAAWKRFKTPTGEAIKSPLDLAADQELAKYSAEPQPNVPPVQGKSDMPEVAVAAPPPAPEAPPEPVAPPVAPPAAAAPVAPSAPLVETPVPSPIATVKETQALLEKRATDRAINSDALTGLGNTRSWKEALPAAEADPNLSVVRWDANGFKALNDAAGHEAGDQALKDMGAAVQQALKEAGVPDRSFRPGGDEFAAIVPKEIADQVKARAEAIYGVREHSGGKVSISGGAGATNHEADLAAMQAKQAAKVAQGIPNRVEAAPAPALVNEPAPAVQPATFSAAEQKPIALKAPVDEHGMYTEARDAKGKLLDMRRVSTDALVKEHVRQTDRQATLGPEYSYSDELVRGDRRAGKDAGQWQTYPHDASIERPAFDSRNWEQTRATIDKINKELERRGVSDVEFGDLYEKHSQPSRNRAGAIAPQLLAPLGGSAVGGFTGSQIGDTPEERRRNAIIGAAAGASLGYLGARMLKAGIKVANPIGLADPAVKQVLDKVALKPETPKGELGTVSEKAYQQIVDDAYPLRQFGRVLGQGHALSHEIDRAGSWAAAGTQRIQDGLTPVLEKAKGVEPQVIALATAERAIELHGQGLDKKGIDLGTAQRAQAALSKIPQVRDAVDGLRAYYRELLQYKLDNGVISQTDFDNLVAKGEHYIPFVRDFVTEAQGTGGRGLLQMGKATRKMTDAEAVSKIRNPFEQAVADTYITERAVARQRVTNMVVKAYDANPPSVTRAFFHEVKADARTTTGQIVKANVGGHQRTFEINDQELYNAWASLAPASQDYAGALLSGFKNVLQKGVTTNPVFAIRHGARGIMFANATTRGGWGSAAAGAVGGAITGAASDQEHPLKGAAIGAGIGLGLGRMAPFATRSLMSTAEIMLHQAGKSSSAYKEFLREGGNSFGFFPENPTEAAAYVDRVGKGFDWSSVVSPRSWLNVMHMVNQAVEQGPRFATFKLERGAGASVPAAIAAAKDASINFGAHGSGKAMRFLTSSTAFLNPKIQGWDKLIRTFVGDRSESGTFRFGAKQAKAWATGAAAITAPTVALWAINKDNPEYWNRPLWERNMFWLVPKADGQFIKIPKPFEYGYAFASIPERFLDYMYKKDPAALGASMKELAGSSIGNPAQFLPTVAAPALAVGAGPGGYDFFRDAPVVSPDLQDLPPELQYNDQTSSAAMAAGKLGLSPQKADQLIGGYTGGLGQYASQKITQAARATGVDERGAPAFTDRQGMFAPLTTNPSSSPAPVNAAYDRYVYLQQVYAGLSAIGKEGNGPLLQRYLAKHQQDLQDYYRYEPIMAQMKQLAQSRRQIESNTAIPQEQRRSMIQQFREQSSRLASMLTPQPAAP